MRRMKPWLGLLSALILVACNMPSTGGGTPQAALVTPTLSGEEMLTQVSQMLTVMPSATGPAPANATPSPELPTLPPADAATTYPKPVVITETPAPEPTATTAAVEPTATATTAAAATATQAPASTFTPPAGDPRTRLGSPSSTDPMDDASTWVWPTGSDKYSSTVFGGGLQTITALDELDGWRMANPTGREFSNLYIEGTFRTGECSGSDHYGIIARVPVVREPDQGYLFGVTCDGKYSLRRWNAKVGTKGEMKWLVNWTANSAILTGSNQTNRLGIFTSGSRLIMYANGTLLGEVQDSTYPSGYFGVFVGSDVTPNLAVTIDEMSYWENPQP